MVLTYPVGWFPRAGRQELAGKIQAAAGQGLPGPGPRNTENHKKRRERKAESGNQRFLTTDGHGWTRIVLQEQTVKTKAGVKWVTSGTCECLSALSQRRR